MNGITGSVGSRGSNRAEDVSAVQALLNLRTGFFDMQVLPVTGVCGADTIRAIRNYQVRVLGQRRADGRVDPGGATWRALALSDPATLLRERNVARIAKTKLSGRAWLVANEARFPNSQSVSDLTPGFAAQVNAFLGALARARATVRISATRRNRSRAWMMHYSWRLARGEITPGDIPADPDADIIWDHGDAAQSRRAAQEMVDFFHIAYRPSLTSNHIRGTAIDMTISWSDPIEIVDAGGRTHRIDRPRSGADNTALHSVGASYGVLKLLSDPPHWSANGH